MAPREKHWEVYIRYVCSNSLKLSSRCQYKPYNIKNRKFDIFDIYPNSEHAHVTFVIIVNPLALNHRHYSFGPVWRQIRVSQGGRLHHPPVGVRGSKDDFSCWFVYLD